MISGKIRFGHYLSTGAITINVAPWAELEVGDRCGINDFSIVTVNRAVTIGNDVMIAEMVSIRDSDHETASVDVPMNRQGFSAEPIVIEDNVWISRGVAVLKGVRIGTGAVIGANAVVTKDIPPYAVAVGVPAKVIRDRRERLVEGTRPDE